MTATLDRVVVSDRGPGVLEIKNAGFYKRKEWETDPPLGVQVPSATSTVRGLVPSGGQLRA